MNKAFTIIEIIFVIIIIGILSVVAIPKMLGMAEESHNAIVKDFVGTLNRSIGVTMWSNSLGKGRGGSIQSEDYCGKMNEMIDIPHEIVFTIGTSDCNTTNLDVNTSSGAVGHIELLNDGNITSPPKWAYIHG